MFRNIFVWKSAAALRKSKEGLVQNVPPVLLFTLGHFYERLNCVRLIPAGANRPFASNHHPKEKKM